MHKNLLPSFVLLFFIISQYSLQAQIEINVQLFSGNDEVEAFFQNSNRKAVPDNPPARLATQYPFLNSVNRIDAVLLVSNSRNSSETLAQFYTLEFSGTNAFTKVQELEQSGLFASVQENYSYTLHEPAYTPNDDSLSKQWFHEYIQSYTAWDITRGDPNIRVGVLDTGIDYNHPEFDGQLAINTFEDLNGNGTFEPWPNTETRNGQTGDFDGVDSDGNGYIDDVIGYDFTDQPRSPFGGDYLIEDGDPYDENAHGTTVSGVIVAKADNGIGGAGIAHLCKVVTLRAFSRTGDGEDDDIARSIIYAADNGIKLLNFSFGDIYPSILMHEAIKYAYARDVVMVASAGNATGDDLHYPSGFNEVISVSGTTADLTTGNEFLWPLSSYGLTVDLAAPSSRIFTPTLQDTASDGTITAFTTTQGTSFAAPMVTAAAALIIAHKGSRTPQEIRGILASSADDLSEPGWDHLTGAGRLNVHRALQVVGASNVQITSPVNDEGSAEDSVYIIGTVLEAELSAYHLEYQVGLEDETEWMPILMDQNYQRKEDTLGIWDLTDLPDGDYTLRLRVEKTNGFSNQDRIRFVRDTSPPEIDVRRNAAAWDNEKRVHMIIFRSSDQGIHTLHYRQVGSSTYQKSTYDRTTRNGEFLLNQQQLSPGNYEAYIETSNLAGLIGQSEPFTFSFSPAYLNLTGYKQLSYTLPMGRFLDEPTDFDGDGLKEVVVGEYDQQLSFGKLKFYEFAGDFFIPVDSIDFKPILIPKGVGDSDKDGLLEIVCSVNDSNYVIEQPNASSFPSTIAYSNLGDTLYAAGFGDTDNDGELELILKNFTDYFVFEGNAESGFNQSANLKDVSPDYAGSNSPRVVVEDFDQDGMAETVYSDFDADFIIYEHTGNQNYEPVYVDSSDISPEDNQGYITSGDFNGNGKPELFVAIHTFDKPNAENEKDAAYWWLRIFEATGNNQYEVVWEDYLYDIDNKRFNAATAGNLDADAADELIFTTFPRTYILDHNGSDYYFQWFQYGALASHHVIGDFDGNGINEFGLGRGDSTFFYERDLMYTGPNPVTSLRGKVVGPNEVRIEWQGSSNATGYEIWRVRDPFNNDTAAVIGPNPNIIFSDGNLTEDEIYLYVLKALNPSLSPNESGFGNAILLRPHALPRVDSIATVSPRQLEIWFTQPVVDRIEDRPRFVLNGKHSPISIIHAGSESKRLILSFPVSFEEGINQLRIDTTFQDSEKACLDPLSTNQSFRYEQIDEDFLHLTRWEAIDEKQALLYFNLPLEESGALDSLNYAISPIGEIAKIEWGSDDMDAIKVTVADARFGALGYPISITVTDVCAINMVCIGDEGNTATFSSHKEDLSEVFVYPNPVRNHKLFDGLRFANLTQQATIDVFTLSGRFVNRLEETDGDGGFEWNMQDEGNKRISPGLYIYKVSTEKEGVEDFAGKFTVVE